MEKPDYLCSIDVVRELIGPKWTQCILCRLFSGTLRFSELQRELPQISHKVLTERLKFLEGRDIVEREVIPTMPIQTKYSLTLYGETLKVLSCIIHQWVLTNPDIIFNPVCIHYRDRKQEMERVYYALKR